MGRRGEGWVVLQFAAGATVAVVAVVGPGVDGLVTLRRAVAIALAAVGVATAVSAARALGHALTPFPRPRPNVPVTRGGPYRVVRHPIYSALIALALSASLAGSLWALVPTVGLCVVLELKATREERWLREARPEYAEYSRAVKWRFVPGIR